MHKNGLDEGGLLEEATRDMRVSMTAISLFENEAAELFAKKRLELSSVVYGLIRITDGDMAREIYLSIETGERCFYETAGRLSEGPEKERMGVVGPVSLVRGNPILNKVLMSLQTGETSEPTLVSKSWFIIRLIKKTVAVLDEATKQDLCLSLLNNSIQQEVDILMNKNSHLAG